MVIDLKIEIEIEMVKICANLLSNMNSKIKLHFINPILG